MSTFNTPYKMGIRQSWERDILRIDRDLRDKGYSIPDISISSLSGKAHIHWKHHSRSKSMGMYNPPGLSDLSLSSDERDRRISKTRSLILQSRRNY